MKAAVLAGTASAALLYSAVIVRIANPQVSPAYADYYISRSSGLSPVERLLLRAVEPGKVYSHRDPAIGYAWWSPPEAKHRWSDGEKAEIVFLIGSGPGTTVPQAVSLDLHTAGKQRVKWQLNGGGTRECLLEGASVWRIPLESGELQTGTNVLTFSFQDATRPGGDDLRRLALAIKSVHFE